MTEVTLLAVHGYTAADWQLHALALQPASQITSKAQSLPLT